MSRGTRIYWLLIALLLGLGASFAVGAERRKRELTGTPEATLVDGELVRLGRVVDGDSVVVRKADASEVPVRLLGVKAFAPQASRDPTERFGRAAVDELGRLFSDKPVRVALHTTPKDRHGRTLATLFVEGRDVGLGLVESGLALVYTVYPFPAMSVYLREQQAARAGSRGLWGDREVARRAELLERAWESEAK
jgi:endonuclease YncB( thermonuclease family)